MVEQLVAPPVINGVQLVYVLYDLNLQNGDAQHTRVLLVVGINQPADV